MGKYNIINKSPEGNKLYKDYIVKYQVNEQPEIYEAKMVCINYEGDIRYAFLDDGQPLSFIDDDNEKIERANKQEFVDEIKKYQKGSSYRKTHPIAYSEKDSLKNQIKELQAKLAKIELEEFKNKKNEYYEFIEKYSQDEGFIKAKEDIEKYTSNDSDYQLKYQCVIDEVVLINKKSGKNLPIYKLCCNRFKSLSDYDIECLIRYNSPNN